MAKKFEIRNSTAEFLMFVAEGGKTGADWDSAPEQTGTLLMRQS